MINSTNIVKPQNAFTAVKPATRIQPTQVSKKLATRVNKDQRTGCWITNSQKAPR